MQGVPVCVCECVSEGGEGEEGSVGGRERGGWRPPDDSDSRKMPQQKQKYKKSIGNKCHIDI